MTDDEIEHLKILISEFKRRKNVLEIQSAKLGLYVPAHILIEIEDLNKEIRSREERIKLIQDLRTKGKPQKSQRITSRRNNPVTGIDIKAIRIGISYNILIELKGKVGFSQDFIRNLYTVAKELLAKDAEDAVKDLGSIFIKAILRTHPGGMLYEEDFHHFYDAIHKKIFEYIVDEAAFYGLITKGEGGFSFARETQDELATLISRIATNANVFSLREMVQPFVEVSNYKILLKGDGKTLKSSAFAIILYSMASSLGWFDYIQQVLEERDEEFYSEFTESDEDVEWDDDNENSN